MSDRERLVAAFLDGEAGPEDREAFLGALQTDSAFARGVAGLLVTERLLRLQASDGEAFAREVLERLGPAPRSIERRVVRRVRRPWIPWAVAAGALVAAATVIVLDRARVPDPPAATVALEAVEGPVEVFSAERWHPASPSPTYAAPARFRTGSGSRAVFRFADGSRLTLRAESEIRELLDRRAALERGGLFADFRPQPASRPASIRTPHGEVTVLGTRFRLDVDDRHTRVEVEEGRVRATRADRESVEVGEGRFAVVEPGVELVARPVRVGSGIVALYRLYEAEGGRVRDVSGGQPALDFTMRDAAGKPMAEPWKIGRGATVTFAVPPARLVEAVRRSRAITIEMWLRLEGAAEVTHVARTFDASGVVRIYADGVEKARQRMPLDLAGWDGDFRKLLADEVARQWPWPGEYHLLAIYDRMLGAEEVRRNFESGRPR